MAKTIKEVPPYDLSIEVLDYCDVLYSVPDGVQSQRANRAERCYSAVLMGAAAGFLPGAMFSQRAMRKTGRQNHFLWQLLCVNTRSAQEGFCKEDR